MPKKGENIYLRKDGRWEGRYILYYKENGKPKWRSVYGKTYNEVKNKLIAENALVTHQTENALIFTVSYSDILDRWLSSVQIGIKRSTYTKYSHMVNSHIKPGIGKYPLAKISTQLVEGYVKNLLVSGRTDKTGGLSPKTANDILAVIKSSMEYAKANNFTVICDLSKLSVKRTEKEMRVLSISEQRSLMNVLTKDTDRCKFGVLLALCTGIRLGELCALTWDAFDLDNNKFRIRKTMQRIASSEPHKTEIVITDPKSETSARDIPLHPFISDIAKRFFTGSENFILTNSRDKFIEPRTMQNRFKTYIKESGIADANFHALRHTFATRCIEAGFDIKSLSEILGHANPSITLNRYVHSSFELKCENMKKLNFG